MPNDPIRPPTEPTQPPPNYGGLANWRDYLKPGSMTWWTGLASIGFGGFLISQGRLDEGIGAIMAGFAAIGLRRAIG